MAAVDVVNRLHQLKITAIHIKLRARGGTDDKAQDQEPKLLLELLLEMALKSAESKMWLPSPQTQGRHGRRLWFALIWFNYNLIITISEDTQSILLPIQKWIDICCLDNRIFCYLIKIKIEEWSRNQQTRPKSIFTFPPTLKPKFTNIGYGNPRYNSMLISHDGHPLITCGSTLRKVDLRNN